MSRALSQKLEDAIRFCRGRKELTFFDFLEVLGSSSPAFLSLIFSLAFLFLAWIPGLNMVFAAIIFISGIQVALNKTIWVPQAMKRCKISGDKMAHRLVKWVKFLKKIEKAIHLRAALYQQSPFFQTFNGFILSLCGFFLFLPLGLFANFLPSLAVFILSFGILEEDLWTMIAAYAVLIIKILLLFLPHGAPVS